MEQVVAAPTAESRRRTSVVATSVIALMFLIVFDMAAKPFSY